MKIASWALAVLGVTFLPLQPVFAQDKAYFGVAMFNPHYIANSVDHRSTGLMGRLGYELSKHFAMEMHFGGSIGAQTNLSNTVGRAQMDSLYGGFLRVNSHFGFARPYLLAGVTYGTRVLAPAGSSVATRDHESTKSYGLGVEFSDNQKFRVVLELVRYFDNRLYTVDAWNVGFVNHF